MAIDPFRSFDNYVYKDELQEKRLSRIESLLQKKQQQTVKTDVSHIARLAITKQAIETVHPQILRFQDKLTKVAKQDSQAVASIKQRLAASAQETNQAIAEAGLHLEDLRLRSRLLFDAMFNRLTSLRNEMENLGSLDKRLETQIQIGARDYAHFKQEIDKELQAQQGIKDKIQHLEGCFEKSKEELNLLQSNLSILKNDLIESDHSLLEMQRQEESLQKNMAALEREIKKCKNRNANFRIALIAVGIAAIGMGLLLVPSVGVAAGGPIAGVAAGGSEVSLSLLFTGEGASLALASGGAMAAGAVVLSASDKKGDSKPSKGDSKPSPLNKLMVEVAQAEERGETLDQIKQVHLASQFFDAVQYPISKTVELAATSLVKVGTAVCNVHPVVHEGCTYTASKINQAYQAGANYLAEPIKKIERAYHVAKNTYTENNLRLNIPTEISDQAFDDSLNVFASSFTMVSGKATLKGIKNVVKLPGKELSQVKPSGKEISQAKPSKREPSKVTSTNKDPQNQTVPLQESSKLKAPKRELPLAKNPIIAINEKALIQSIESSIKKIELPNGFSPHFSSFLSKVKYLEFRKNKLGSDGKGRVKGLLLYQKVNDEALFVMRRGWSGQFPKDREILEKTWSWQTLIEGYHVTQNERIHVVLNTIAEFAKKENLKNVYIAWDPKHYPLATALKNHWEEGLNPTFELMGLGKFSAGKTLDPFVLMKLKSPQ